MATKNIIHVSGASDANSSRLQIFEEIETASGGTILKTLRKLWDSLNFATAAQGAKADTAVQPAELASAVLYSNGDVTPVNGSLALETNGVKRLAFAANAVDEVTLVLPEPTIEGTTLDFVLDVENPPLDSTAESWPDAYDSTATYAVGDKASRDGKIYSCNTADTTGTWDATKWDEAMPELSIDGLDNTISVVVPEGETLTDWLVIAPGEMSEFYFTLTAHKVNGLPTWKVVKQVVENGGAQS